MVDHSNKIDLVEMITKFGSEAFQDFEGFSSSEEQELLINEINKHKRICDYKQDPEFTQQVCDIVLLKLVGELNEGEFDVTYYVDKVLDYMVFWMDILNCRYLMKSGIDWTK